MRWRKSTMKKAIIMMIVVFALVVWPFSGVWQLLSGIIGGGVRESFIYPIYGGIILLSGIIVVCTELILEEIRSLKDDIKDKKEALFNDSMYNSVNFSYRIKCFLSTGIMIRSQSIIALNNIIWV